MSDSSHDAQRDLERKALRNVRGLLDKLETDEVLRGRALRRYLFGIAIGLAVIVVLFAAGWTLFGPKETRPTAVEIPPPAKAVK